MVGEQLHDEMTGKLFRLASGAHNEVLAIARHPNADVLRTFDQDIESGRVRSKVLQGRETRQRVA